MLTEAQKRQAHTWASLACLDPRCECNREIPTNTEMAKKLWPILQYVEDLGDIESIPTMYVSWNHLCPIHGKFIEELSGKPMSDSEREQNVERWYERMFSLCAANSLAEMRKGVTLPLVSLD